MKIGFCMLLWMTRVDDSHRGLLEDIKATGYDGVEIPVFDGGPAEYAEIGRMLDEIGLARTAITVIPTEETNPLAEDPATRRSAVAHINHCVDCAQALGADQLAGPLHQTLGHFSGAATTAHVTLDGRRSILGSHLDFGEAERGWSFVSPGHGDVDFEVLLRELNRIGYHGPLSVEWEDSGMDRDWGAPDSVSFLRRTDFPASALIFDAAFQGSG